jgi:ornithine cyclodeaminase/alanine dehydrogenase-like protein (mu-crystallin family)
MRLLTAADVAQALTMPEAIAAMRLAFSQISSGAAQVPPRVATPSPRGVTLTMPAFLPDSEGALAVKVVSVYPENRQHGLSAIQGAVLVLDPATGRLQALIDGPALTALRTGAATGLATDLLARPDARILTIFGAGGQSAQQIAGVRAVRPLSDIRILRRHHSPSAALRDSDIVVTATNSPTPVFPFADLPAGVHVNAIGSYRPEMRELDAETIAHAKVVVDCRHAARSEAGELQGEVPIHAELGELLAGTQPGRTRPEELTVFKSVGHAAQDAAIARAILSAAQAQGLGQIFDFG